MASPRASLVADVKASLGESPVWHERTRTLFHVDINGKTVYATRGAETTTVATLPSQVGCVVPRASGGLLACLERDVRHIDVGTGAVSSGLVAVPEDHLKPSMRFNDGKVDPSGKYLFAGTMHSAWRDPASPTGRLYRITAAASSGAHGRYTYSWGTRPWSLAGAAAGALVLALGVSRVRSRGSLATATCATAAAVASAAAMAAETVSAMPDEISPWSIDTVVPVTRVPNGIAWTADTRTMFWIDSANNTVEAFDASVGGMSNRRVAVTCPKQGQGTAVAIGGIPDGQTIDAAGKLWVALAESGHVVQYDPETGKQLMAVPMPVKRVTACTFGGDDLSELYVTTREEPGEGGSPHAGGVFKVLIPGVRGLHAAYEFKR